MLKMLKNLKPNYIKCCRHFTYIIAWISFIILLSFGFIVIYTKNIENHLIKCFIKHKSLALEKNINVLKKTLTAQALAIVLNEKVTQAYLKDDPYILYSSLKPVWEALHNYFNVYEMHFFKYPNQNFLSFFTGSTKNFCAKVRADIKFIENTSQIASYFFVCRRFAGLRATFPIKINNQVLGALSYGIEMEFIKDILEKNLNLPIFYILNKTLLKQNLAPENFRKYYSHASKMDKNFLYFHINKTFSKKDIEKGYKRINSKIILFYPLFDYKNSTIGYLGTLKDYKEYYKYLKTALFVSTFILFFGFIILIYVLIKFNIFIQSKVDDILKYLKLIEYGHFDRVIIDLKEEKSRDYIFEKFYDALKDISTSLKLYFKNLEKELKLQIKKSHTDPLTGLYNRLALKTLDKQLKAFPKNYTYSLIMLDIDFFKKINDTYGHLVGDKVLSKLGEIIKSFIRENDVAIRYGGEEFLIFLPQIEIEDAIKIAERLRKKIENTKLITNGNEIKFTISLGVTEGKAQEDFTSVINRADKALYLAKRRGRNRVEFIK